MSIEEKFSCSVCGLKPISGFYRDQPLCRAHLYEAMGKKMPSEKLVEHRCSVCSKTATLMVGEKWMCSRCYWRRRKEGMQKMERYL